MKKENKKRRIKCTHEWNVWYKFLGNVISPHVCYIVAVLWPTFSVCCWTSRKRPWSQPKSRFDRLFLKHNKNSKVFLFMQKAFLMWQQGNFCFNWRYWHVCVTGKPLWTGPPTFVDTIAEGIRVRPIGKKVFPVMLKYVEKDVFSIVSIMEI